VTPETIAFAAFSCAVPEKSHSHCLIHQSFLSFIYLVTYLLDRPSVSYCSRLGIGKKQKYISARVSLEQCMANSKVAPSAR